MDKRDLFEAVCADAVGRLAGRLSERTMARARRGEDELGIGAVILIEEFADPEGAQILLVDGPAVLGFDAWRAILAPVVLALLHHGLGHLAEAGRLREEQAEPIANLLFGAIVQAAAAIGTAPERERALAAYATAVGGLLDGIGAVPADR